MDGIYSTPTVFPLSRITHEPEGTWKDLLHRDVLSNALNLLRDAEADPIFDAAQRVLSSASQKAHEIALKRFEAKLVRQSNLSTESEAEVLAESDRVISHVVEEACESMAKKYFDGIGQHQIQLDYVSILSDSNLKDEFIVTTKKVIDQLRRQIALVNHWKMNPSIIVDRPLPLI